MTYSTTKFEVATSNGLGGDTFTRNVTDGQTDGRWTDFDTKLIYHFFLKKKAGIISICNWSRGRRFYPFVSHHILRPNSVHAGFNFRRLAVHMPSKSIVVMKIALHALLSSALSVFKIKNCPEKQ